MIDLTLLGMPLVFVGCGSIFAPFYAHVNLECCVLYAFGQRLKEERDRLGLSQVDMGEAGGVGRATQAHYEANNRAPGADYLLKMQALGVDVGYVLLGVPTVEPDSEESNLVRLFRHATPELRRAAVAVLQSGPVPAAEPSIGVQFNAEVSNVDTGPIHNPKMNFHLESKPRRQKKGTKS